MRFESCVARHTSGTKKMYQQKSSRISSFFAFYTLNLAHIIFSNSVDGFLFPIDSNPDPEQKSHNISRLTGRFEKNFKTAVFYFSRKEDRKMYFTTNTSLLRYEVMMQEIPNFLPRGYGTYIYHRDSIPASQTNCQYCLYYHSGKCSLEECPFLECKIANGTAALAQNTESGREKLHPL